MSPDTLIFGWGNPSRGDDALGPLFVERFENLARTHPEWGAIEFLTDFQLQVEHALDLTGRLRVLFVDADASLAGDCRLEPVVAARDDSFTSHAMSPQSVLAVFEEIEDERPPAAWLLAIRGEHFELGEALSPAAEAALEKALALAEDWISAS